MGNGRESRRYLGEARMKSLLLICIIAVLSASASTPAQSDAQRLALYRDNAGEAVRQFRYSGTLSGWTALGDSALAVWTRPNQAYLLELTGPCPDLGFATAIGITHQSGQVSARFDDVLVFGGGTSTRFPCRIQTIRPLDVSALKTAQQELRQAQAIEREAAGN
jgi:hypothetical protein